MDTLIVDVCDLKKYFTQLTNCYQTQEQYQKVIRHLNKINRLLVLDTKIEQELSKFNALNDIIGKQTSLNKQQRDLKIELEKLKVEFSNAVPDICPLFDVPCDHIKNQKSP